MTKWELHYFSSQRS